MNNLIAMFKNWKTTIAGVLPFIIAILNQVGLISVTPDAVVELVGHSFDGIITLLTAVVAIIGIFSRDADKSSQDSGIRK